jgi:hypothetical protein
MSHSATGISGIDVSAAAAAIESAGGVETVLDPSHQRGEAVTPASEPQTTVPGTQQTTTTTQQQYERDPQTGQFVPRNVTPTEPETVEPFWNGDPNTLPTEVQPVYKQLQADYTRKTQELAAQRKQFESMGDLGTVAEAVQLHQALQNPEYWPQLYSQLKQGMEEMGLTPEEAHVAAATEVNRQATATDPLASLEDPEFAPIKTAYEQMKNELSSLKGEWEAQKERERAEQLQTALVGELQRQENFLRQSNPHYTDGDVEAIYELSSFHNGNLIKASERYEAMVQDRMTRWMNEKGGAVAQHGSVVGASNAPVAEKPQFKNLDDAHAALMERLRNIEAAD